MRDLLLSEEHVLPGRSIMDLLSEQLPAGGAHDDGVVREASMSGGVGSRRLIQSWQV